MSKYNEGKVYKLVLPDKRIYIGCTTSTLTKKLYQHKVYVLWSHLKNY